jgi:hypothetical protein
MWAFAVAAWVAVVIAGSGLTWIAIERAGDQVTAAPESAGATQPPVLGTVGPAPTAAVPSGTPSVPSPAATTPTHSSPPPSPSSPVARPSSQPTSAPPPAARAEVRTWSGSAGSLTVSCTGREVSFRSATPSDGWSFERGDSSGEDIEVTFKSGEGEVQVRATCSGGVPQFRVQSESDHE